MPTYPHVLDWVAEWNDLTIFDLLQIGTKLQMRFAVGLWKR